MAEGGPPRGRRRARGGRLTASVLVATALLITPTGAVAQDPEPAESPGWQVFRIEELQERRTATGRPWLQFLQVPDLFAGVYEIEAGGTDEQSPHTADEVYYVVSGRATLVVEGERTAVEPGTVAYVGKDLEHRFEDVLEDLTVLVFFATPGGS